ncbi:carbohydrate ABC transporter permease [Alicyclobacillus acidiphilus]|uniref:carbohydrate ABC transporter permease n=1 Tax=Alicyclobacillus acidiphilus TaxID=182455 RepID=UPI00082C19EB|nr:sugar ABC transporter permease [Alicyclobacillus acidiphilus]
MIKADVLGKASVASTKRSKLRKSLLHHAGIYLFLLPAIAFFVVFSVYPILYSFIKSFTNWPVYGSSQFVGLQNYSQVLHDPVVGTSLVNALFYMVVSVPIQVVLGLLVAIGLDRPMRGRAVFRLMYYIPVITSWVVVTLLFEYLFNTDYGIINWVLESLHITHTAIPWLADRYSALTAAAILGGWKGIGWAMMIFLAGLQGVPDELYESAAIDGAGKWQRLWSITLPMIRGSFFFVTVMLVMGSFQVFISVFILTGGAPANETQVPLVWMYQQAFTNLNFGYAGAFSWIITGIIIVLTVIQFLIFKPRGAKEA